MLFFYDPFSIELQNMPLIGDYSKYVNEIEINEQILHNDEIFQPFPTQKFIVHV